MRFKNILTYFYIALVTAVVLRTYQLIYAIDNVTGFFKQPYRTVGTLIMAAIFAIILSVGVISATVHRCPIKMPHVDYFTGGVALVTGLSILYNISTSAPTANVPSWQRILLNLTGLAAGLFFCLYSVKSVKKFKIPSFAFIIPVLFFIVKLIYTFTSVSSLALITDNILILLTYICVLLFMFELAKLANGLDSEKGYKKILVTGLTAVILCAVSSVSNILAAAVLNHTDLRESFSSIVSNLFIGLFIFRFIRIHFSGRNLRRHRHKKHSVKFMGGDGGNNFYMG